jgi:Fe-S-cluster containining protein
MDEEKEHRIEIITPHSHGQDARPKKRRLQARSECIRCGECCTVGAPVLLRDDLPLFASGVLSHEHTFAVREGEMVRSVRDNELYESAMELIKIRERGAAGGCVFFDADEGCRIYAHRPAQCRAYKCWAPDEMITGLKDVALRRADLFAGAEVLLQVIARHDEKCSYGRLAAALDKIAGNDESAVEEILDMLQYDAYARTFVQERFGFPAVGIDLLLGRPLTDTIREFGLEVVEEDEGYVLGRRGGCGDSGGDL